MTISINAIGEVGGKKLHDYRMGAGTPCWKWYLSPESRATHQLIIPSLDIAIMQCCNNDKREGCRRL